MGWKKKKDAPEAEPEDQVPSEPEPELESEAPLYDPNEPEIVAKKLPIVAKRGKVCPDCGAIFKRPAGYKTHRRKCHEG